MSAADQLRTVRCARCYRSRYVIPSENWPCCCGETMRDQADVQRLEEKRNELRLRVGEMAAFTVVLERSHPKAEEQKLFRLADLADKGRQDHE